MNGDLARLREAIDLVSGAREEGDFGDATVAALRALIPGEVFSYNEVPLVAGGTMRVVATPAIDEYTTAMGEAFVRHVGQNPLVEHFGRTGDGSARRFSDLVSRRELHRRDLYQECYRPLGVESQVAVSIAGEGRIVGLTVSRGARDFSEREVELLDVAARTIWLVYRGLRERARTATAFARLESSSAEDEIAVLRALGLTGRQSEVLRLLALGLTNREIAGELVLSPHTVDHHVERILARLGVAGRIQATRVAIAAIGAPGLGT